MGMGKREWTGEIKQMKMKALWEQWVWVFAKYSQLWPHRLEQCLACARHLIHMCWMGTQLWEWRRDKSWEWPPSFRLCCLAVPWTALSSGVHTWGNQQGNCANSTSLNSCQGPEWEGTIRADRFLDIHQPQTCILQIERLKSRMKLQIKVLRFSPPSSRLIICRTKGQGVAVPWSGDHS